MTEHGLTLPGPLGACVTGPGNVLEANPGAHADLLTRAAQLTAGVTPAEWEVLRPRQRDEMINAGHAALVRAGGSTPAAWRAMPFLSARRSGVLLAGAAELGIPVGWLEQARRQARQPAIKSPGAFWDASAETGVVTNLTRTEAATLRTLSASRLAAVTRRLLTGPAEGRRGTGPARRQEITRQVGWLNLRAISASQVVPLPDGIELPVTASSYAVQVRLSADGTFGVRRVRVVPEDEVAEGDRESVDTGEVGEAAWLASCFRSYFVGGWTAAR